MNWAETLLHADLKTWACKDQPKKSWACAGPKSKNINVVFSGYADISNALDSALFKDSAAVVCTDTDKSWCLSQADFMVSTYGQKTSWGESSFSGHTWVDK